MKPPEDPAVALVEEILDGAASRHARRAESLGGKAAAKHALWICACVTMDDAPIWLIYDTADEDLVWQRIPGELEWHDLIDAEVHAGGHADPSEVLRWLRGEVDVPDRNGGWIGGDHKVLAALRARILS